MMPLPGPDYSWAFVLNDRLMKERIVREPYFSSHTDLSMACTALRHCSYRCQPDSLGEWILFRAIAHLEKRIASQEWRSTV